MTMEEAQACIWERRIALIMNVESNALIWGEGDLFYFMYI